MNVPAEVFLETEASLKAIADSKGLTQYGDCRFAVAAFGIVDANNVVKTAAQLGGGGSGNISVIDLGIVNTARIVAADNLLELMPHVAGRLVHRVFFTVGSFEPFDTGSGSSINIFTPNTVKSGLARITAGVADVLGTGGIGLINDGATGLINPGQGIAGGDGTNLLMVRGPILATFMVGSIYEFNQTFPWTADTKWAFRQVVLDSNGGLQYCTTPGTGGSEEPDWDDSSEGATTSDGTAEWTCGVIPEAQGAIHVFATVSDLPGSTDDIPVPASMEFVQQPTDVVAEETITPAIQVRVLDQNGDPYVLYIAGLRVAIMGEGTLTGTDFQDIDKTTGIATWNDLSITEPGTYQLRVLSCELMAPSIISDPFDVT